MCIVCIRVYLRGDNIMGQIILFSKRVYHRRPRLRSRRIYIIYGSRVYAYLYKISHTRGGRIRIDPGTCMVSVHRGEVRYLF